MAFQQGQMPDEKLALDAVNRFLLPPWGGGQLTK